MCMYMCVGGCIGLKTYAYEYHNAQQQQNEMYSNWFTHASTADWKIVKHLFLIKRQKTTNFLKRKRSTQ